jgi:hypothetical protein
VKPKLKAVNKPLPHSIVHVLDKPGRSATVSKTPATKFVNLQLCPRKKANFLNDALA